MPAQRFRPMNATIIAIGDELLVGQVVNTNATWLADQLTRIGWHVRRVIAVGDNPAEMRAEIESAVAASDAVVMSGGLGPTHDDRTRDVICAMLGCGLVSNEEQLERIRVRFAERGVTLNERSIRQAEVPELCRVLPNEYGSAPGLAFSIGASRLFALPGVPTEMKGIFADHIIPELAELAGRIEQQTFLLFGVPESTLADTLAETEALLSDTVTLAYLPSSGMIRLRAMRWNTEPDTQARYSALLEIIRAKARPWLVSDRDEPLAAALGHVLRERGIRLAVAESCTGGLIGALLTDTPGASEYFLGGVVSYANEVKQGLLGVSAESLGQHGAVSREVAEQMASGALRAMGAELAVSVTGIAGPDGGSDAKPVGTVWIGVATLAGCYAECFQFGRERDVVRQRAASMALELARRAAMALPSATA